MDQTKFINSYIANLAERLKALTLDNIMLNTQLTMANESLNELQKKIQVLEDIQAIPVPKSDYMGLDGKLKSDYSYTGAEEPYLVDDVEQPEKENLDDSSGDDSTDKKK
jgi:hypothetical protein